MKNVMRFGVWANGRNVAMCNDCVDAIKIAQGYSKAVSYMVDVCSNITGEVIATFHDGQLLSIASVDYDGDGAMPF